MKKLFKPACLLLYLLTAMVFFLMGLLYAGWVDAGKNQSLVGAAIVLSHGFIFSFVALLLSFFVAYHLNIRTIVKINLIFSILVLAGALLILYKVNEGKKLRETETEPIENLKSTKPVEGSRVLAMANTSVHSNQPVSHKLGPGFFKLNFYDNPSW